MIIGITGKIGCGKTTCAKYLQKTRSYTEYCFANPLKNTAILLGFKQRQVYGTQEQKLEINEIWNMSGRQFLQMLGTDILRKIKPDIWVNLFENEIKNNPSVKYVVSDVRFPNEADAIRKLGGKIIRIVGSQNPEFQSFHESETAMDGIKSDITIYNNGTIKQLENIIDLQLIAVKKHIK